jgi:protein-S-isoprenylcysteine O-methyltransferase Ste14
MRVNILLLVGQTVALFAIMALALFLPAGTLAWPVGWAYLGLFFGFFLAVNAWLFRHDPGLLEERLHLGAANQQGWDRRLFPLLAVLPILLLVFASFDAVRFHWSPVAPLLQLVGLGLLLGSFYLFFLTFRENSYLSPVVRLQAERGHTVISTGPYHYVRHPMYTGIVAFAVGTPLLLGSGYGVLCGLILVVLVARRAVLEERTLRGALPGYAAYMGQVRYRFIPHVW